MPIAEPELEPVDDVLDNGIDGERQLPEGAPRHPPATRLVPRKPSPIEQEDGRPGAREVVRGQRPGGPRADDNGVEALHPAIVRLPSLENV